jgi:chorismate mutase
VKGKTLTFVMQICDEPGLLSEVLNIVADYKANILTIHQSIPTNGVATLTLSVEVLPETGDISSMIETIEHKSGIQYVKILARE